MKTLNSPTKSKVNGPAANGHEPSVSNKLPAKRVVAPNALPRRSFLRRLGIGAMVLAPGAAMIGAVGKASAKNSNGPLSRGDAAILRFLAAAEILESDLWEQYWELGGVPFGENVETPRGETPPVFSGGNAAYITALQILDGDMPQYITDNTDDEFSHQAFIRAYLVSKGANTADIDLLAGPTFRTIPGSTAIGSSGKKRLTNLTMLTIDTSYWGRYRSADTNPDLGDTSFAQAVPTLNMGLHTAIPRTNDDTKDTKLINAIAFTAGFHFAFIEQGGTSLYPTLAQKVTNLEVRRILLSIGRSETMQFKTWQDKAGNALPLDMVHDPVNKSTVTFTDLHAGLGESANETDNQGKVLQANLIMPEPTHFLDPKFTPVAIIRPTSTKLNGAVAAVQGFVTDNLFLDPTTGRNTGIVDVLMDLAE